MEDHGEEREYPVGGWPSGIYSKMYRSDRRRMLDFFYKARVGEAKHFQGEMRIERPGEKGKWNWVRTNVVVNLFEPENGQIEQIRSTRSLQN